MWFYESDVKFTIIEDRAALQKGVKEKQNKSERERESLIKNISLIREQHSRLRESKRERGRAIKRKRGRE